MVTGHAFLSYVRQDAEAADRLQRVLEAAGIRVWRDTASLWPGEDWRMMIRRAITEDALAFIACFSQNSAGREKTYQNEELDLALEQLRQRQPDRPWLIPVRFDDCDVPDRDIGAGRTLRSIQRADLFGDRSEEGVARLVATVLRILGQHSAVTSSQPRPAAPVGMMPGPVPEIATDLAAGLTGHADAAMPARTRGIASVVNGRPAVTNRWRLTDSIVDVIAMSQLGSQGFDHQAYMRSAEQTPPWVRIRAVVACDPLGDNLGRQELRGRFAGLLSQESIRGLIYQLTEIPDGAIWRPRGTPRRSWLEADLTVEDPALAPAATVNLFFPEPETLAGLAPGCAQLTLHVDFAPRPAADSSDRTSRRPPYWRARFEQAVALPGELAHWLQHQLGLATSGQPAAQFGIILNAGRHPVTEMVDPAGIRALPAPSIPNQFTGWAVADADGRTARELAERMMLDLSEGSLHLDGSIEQMSGLL
jgi:hypothetical protein